MPDEFPDLPKFPEESRQYEEAMTELDRRTAERQTGVGSSADWLRHTWPALAIAGFTAIGLYLLLYTLTKADEVLIFVPGPLLIGFVVLRIVLARRHYRNRPN